MPVEQRMTQRLWKTLRRPDCTRCPLHEGAKSVCVLGDGPTPAKLMAIGEAPGEREDDEERPFAGSAGRILDDALERNGLDRSMFYVTNGAKCRPPGNRKPKASELSACNVFLRAELRIHKPEFVLLLGDSALKAALGMSGIMANRQRVIERGGTKFFIALHPAAGLHRPGFKQLFQDDIAAFARLVRGEDIQEKTKVKLIRSQRDFQIFLRRLSRENTVAFDVETEGVPYVDGPTKKHGTVTIFGAAFKRGEAWVVPLDHAEGWAPKRWLQNLLEIAKRLFGRGKKLIAHNGKYDLRWFLDLIPNAEYTFDTMFAAFLLNENRSMSLENLSLSELKVSPWKSDVEYRRDFPLRKYAIYNAKDCDYTFRLYELYKPQLQQQSKLGRVFKTLMMPTANIFARIEHRGIYLPNNRLQERLAEAKKKEQAALKKLMSFVPKKLQPFNPGSSEQMARLLYSKDGLNLPFPVEAGEKAQKSNKGLGSTAETPLKLLNHPISAVIEEWRYLKQKVIATYFERWNRLRDPDGVVHFVYNLIGAVTGRISSDLHQVPRDSFVRGVLSIKDDEWYFGAADFSQAEMRIAAHLSQDPVLLDIFRTGRIDVHTNTAMRLIGASSPKKVDSESRKKAKAVNFGFLYRMFEKKFRDYARDKFGVKLTLPEARAFRKLFFQEYARLVDWHNRAIKSVKMRGFMEYLDGRLRRLPDIWSDSEGSRAEAERQAINSPVQGLVSDMALFSMVIGEYGGFGFKPIVDKDFKWMGQMHDEVIFAVRKKAFKRKARELKYLMENLPLKRAFGFKLTVPIEAEVKRGQFWGEAKAWEPEKEAA